MAKPYDHKAIEAKWAQEWVEKKIFAALDDSNEPKSYILIEFPYPSGERLHVGHARSYSCLDSVARKRRMQGQNVMFPFGWDAFGLPAENYAIKTGIHPSITTAKNISNAKQQAISWGLSFDWDREVNTTDPKYYKWTQWIFLQLFKCGLAYKDEIPVNWCPSCRINLANEEVIAGNCERCGNPTVRRMQSQWLLRITAYADRLLKDLSQVNFRKDIAEQQINWIGRSEGVLLKFDVANTKKTLEVFTTAIDTVYGVTFLVLSPEVAKTIIDAVPEDYRERVSKYIEESVNRSEQDRLEEGKDKTGVEMGMYAIHPFTGESVPLFVANYVLINYGTGVVMGVPGHDERDYQFAKKYKLPIKQVLKPKGGSLTDVTESGFWDYKQIKDKDLALVCNSGDLDGLTSVEAKIRLETLVEKEGMGVRKTDYHLRDWVFSRQHYWGEPIPMVYCSECADKKIGWWDTQEGREYKSRIKNQELRNLTLDSSFSNNKSNMPGWFPVREFDLPVQLPQVEKYQPTDSGESPLANITDWVKIKCPNCGGSASRETDTMPNWAGSSWYFLRYCDPNNTDEIGSMEKFRYWLPVDWYNGGMEHTTLHLLYSRFWHKFLFDLGVVPVSEPYAKRTSHGVILGPDGKRMSKSRGNVINPDEVIEKYGADSLRMYEMFIGPFDQMVVWNDRALSGVHRFISRVWDMACEVIALGREVSDPRIKSLLARLVVKVDQDLENMKFNTAVSSCMEFINEVGKDRDKIGLDVLRDFIKTLAPMAPFVTEEVWQMMLNSKTGDESTKSRSVHLQSWPEVKMTGKEEGSVEVVVQVNGKVRDRLQVLPGQDEDTVKNLALASGKVKSWVKGEILKVIWVQDRLINLVVRD